MSVTTTANPTTYTLRATLADYDIHHSEGGATIDGGLNTHPSPAEGDAYNPERWLRDHRRVPARRPVNTTLDQSQRRVYLHPIERAFVTVMFTGVFVNANLAAMWRKTGGKLKDISYQIGGEW